MKVNMDLPRIKLKPKTRIILQEWIFIIISVDVLMYLYHFFTWWGLRAYIERGLIYDYVSSWYIHAEILIQGTFFGILFGLINYLTDNTRMRQRSFGAVILIKTALYIIAAIISQGFVFLIYDVFHITPWDIIQSMQQEITLRFAVSIGTYFILMILFINFILQINRKFGYGILKSMITGKYHKPRKERRIFMFLDMKDSTGNAQRLGHYQYSRMIQSCINDLTDLIIRYKAQVYQYVGDEVVLTWPTTTGMKDMNCIKLFYAFEQRLSDRSEYYIKYFRAVPVFKAGIDEGSITVAEVGDIKRELAYHGEVLHTAARLEKLCNQLEKNVLITENILLQIADMQGFSNEYIGDYKLRGKENKEKVFGVTRI